VKETAAPPPARVRESTAEILWFREKVKVSPISRTCVVGIAADCPVLAEPFLRSIRRSCDFSLGHFLMGRFLMGRDKVGGNVRRASLSVEDVRAQLLKSRLRKTSESVGGVAGLARFGNPSPASCHVPPESTDPGQTSSVHNGVGRGDDRTAEARAAELLAWFPTSYSCE